MTSEFVAALRSIAVGELPADVRAVAKCCILDWLGAAIAGAREPLVAMLLPEVMTAGDAPCTLIKQTARTSPVSAALINGAAGDALDFSDCNRTMNGHPTATVFPAALALAELQTGGGEGLLRSFVVGVEAACRVGLIVGNGVLDTPFHPTAVAGPFGAASAAACSLGLDAAKWKTALGIAATQAAGLADAVGTMCKPLHAGTAAAGGVFAARLAARGFTGSPAALDEGAGFLKSHTSSVQRNALEAARGRFLIMQTLMKEHAACQLAHGSIENVRRLQRAHAFSAREVKAVRLGIAASSANVCDIRTPRSGLEAKFSVRTVAAMALLGYDTGSLASFDDATAGSAEIVALRDRVSVDGRRDLDVAVSTAAVELSDGRILRAEYDERALDPDVDARRVRALRKFAALTLPLIGAAAVSELQQLVFALDELERIDPLLRLVA